MKDKKLSMESAQSREDFNQLVEMLCDGVPAESAFDDYLDSYWYWHSNRTNALIKQKSNIQSLIRSYKYVHTKLEEAKALIERIALLEKEEEHYYRLLTKKYQYLTQCEHGLISSDISLEIEKMKQMITKATGIDEYNG